MADNLNITLAKALKLKNRLAGRVKAAITRANLPIQKAIFDLAERKAEVALLIGLATKHGVYKEGYPSGGDVAYVAQFRKPDVDALVAKLETEIDQIQDRLDRFNHETTIDIDRRVVEMESA